MEKSRGTYKAIHTFKDAEITPHIQKTIHLLQENSSLVKNYSHEYYAELDCYLQNFTGITTMECYLDRLNKKRTAFRELWIEKIKQAEKQSIEPYTHATSLSICDVFSMEIQIQQAVLVINEVDLEITEPSFLIVWEFLEGYSCNDSALYGEDKEHLKQLLQDLGYFFITKGDDTHVAIMKAHIMKQLNK